MLEQLRAFNVDRMHMDELVSLSAFGRQIKAEFEQLGGEAPDWLDQRLREIRREVRSRQQDEIDRRLREKRARLESLAPDEDKRARLAAEIAALEAKAAQG